MNSDAEIKVGSQWHKNSNRYHVAAVLFVCEGQVQFLAPWSATGVLWKATDSFLAHYTAIDAARQAAGGAK